MAELGKFKLMSTTNSGAHAQANLRPQRQPGLAIWDDTFRVGWDLVDLSLEDGWSGRQMSLSRLACDNGAWKC